MSSSQTQESDESADLDHQLSKEFQNLSVSAQKPAQIEPVCSICYEDHYTIKTTVHPCNHAYCYDCINKWMTEFDGTSCPYCRGTIEQLHTTDEDTGELIVEDITNDEDTADQVTINDLRREIASLSDLRTYNAQLELEAGLVFDLPPTPGFHFPDFPDPPEEYSRQLMDDRREVMERVERIRELNARLELMLQRTPHSRHIRGGLWV